MDKKELAKKKFKERTAAKRFKLPEGSTTFRVLPNKKGLDKAEYIEYAMHSNVGARNAYLRCGKNIRGEGECWLCDALIPKLEKSGKSSHRAAAEKLKRKECFAVQIIYEADGQWVGPTLWEMSTGIANKLLNVMSRRDVSHPQKGYNLSITRTGTTMTGTRYGDIDRDDEKSEVPEELLEKLKTFGEVLRKYDEKVMKAEYYGHEQDDDEPEAPVEEEEEAPAKKPAKKPTKPAVEEEEEGTEPEPEEEEEAAPPKKPAKKPTKPVVEEEEEGTESESAEDEDIPNLEEEEEEPAPKKPLKKPVKKPAVEEEEENAEEEEPAAEDEEEAPAPKKPLKKPSKPARHEEDDE